MRKIITIFLLILICVSCKAQNLKVKNLSENSEMNYTFANIWSGSLVNKEIYNGSLFVKVFKMSDSKATPEGYFEESDEVLESLIISVVPDGDYYTRSEIYKIEGLYSPKILEIIETEYPKFLINIEYGFYDNRKKEIIELDGIK